MNFRHYWYEAPFQVAAKTTPAIKDRRLIDYEPPVNQPGVEKRSVKLYAFIRDEIVPVHIDRPWGELKPESGSGTTVNAGETITLGKNVGYGWIMFFMANLDYESLEIEFYRDSQKIFPTFTPTEMWNTYGLDSGNHLPKMEAYDTSNDEYVVVYDPPEPMHFEASEWVEITNPDTVVHTIANWAQSVTVNREK